MAAWPASLPEYLEVGFGDTYSNGILNSPMDAGPPKARRITTADHRRLTGTMKLSGVQRAALDEFYEVTVGVELFDFTDPVDNSTVSARFYTRPSYQHVHGSGSTSLWVAQLDLLVPAQ